jgi:hypothetical protein
MKKSKKIIIISTAAVIIFSGIFFIYLSFEPEMNNLERINRTPRIFPDYTDIVIPPNIAPLNFIINEPGKQYFVLIKAEKGKEIKVYTKSSNVSVPISQWKEMLSNNRGKKYQVNIFSETKDGKWLQYEPITNNIAEENIDSHLVYRLIHPSHSFWNKMGIYQRNLQNFDETPILENKNTGNSCVNCHNFNNNDPNQMMMHLRAGPGSGTIINKSGKIFKINTRTAFNKAGSYPAWHPGGNIIAYSVNQLTLFFHSVGESRDVLDNSSDLIIYKIDSNTITTTPDISNPEILETFPAWSPDGKYLYFCSAPKLESFVKKETGDLMFGEIKYSLMRISYNEGTDTWGKLETVLSSSQTGLSITEPRVSPDGRFLLFTMSDYSNFPIYLSSSDVYILDLNSGKYYKPNINSDQTESFHSWSSNSRWFVFSSKRGDGLCARPYFSYLDKDGIAHKPFLLPQENPEFYSNFLVTYNVPELIKGPVPVSARKMVEIAVDSLNIIHAKLDPKVALRKTQNKSGSQGQQLPQ